MQTRLREVLKRSAPGSELRRSVLELITIGVMPLVNRLPDEFFAQNTEERLAAIKALTKPGSLRRLAQEWLATGTYAGTASSLHRFARTLGWCPLVVVQSAATLSQEQRIEMQDALAKRQAGSLIVFQTVPSLSGGIRIFADGALTDLTWNGRLRGLISRIQELTYA